MATGGTIPSNRTQSVTFYNTTGVIEREKNVYYVPRFSKTGALAGQDVRTAWLNAFGSVCPPSSDYTAINISTWLPQDRTLRVKGNIDDFRLVTDEGACLNYFIITRSVTKTSGLTVTTQTHYYGFFITGVRQSGGSTVEITCEPDDFTNVFYLHNKHLLTALEISRDYEPFNVNMKNCLVMRQHYNRLKQIEWLSAYDAIVSGTGYNLGDTIEIKDSNNVSQGEFFILRESHRLGRTTLLLKDLDTSRRTLSLSLGTYTIVINGITTVTNVNLFSWDKNILLSSFSGRIDNEKVFLNQKESMPYRYQYRDSKFPISDNTSGYANFTEAEINSIELIDTFSALSSTLREKIVRACIGYLVVETKSMEKIGWYANEVAGGAKYIIKRNAGDLLTDNASSYNPPRAPSNNGVMPNVRIAFPTMVIPNEFKKYASSIESEFYYEYTYGNTVYWQPISKPINLMWSLSKSALSDFIYSMYYVKDVGIKQSDIVVDLQYQHVNIKCNVEIFEPTGGNVTSEGCVVGVMPIPLAKNETVEIGVAFEVAWNVQHEIIAPVFDTTNYWWGLSIGNNVKDIKLQLDERLYNRLSWNSYFDPVLESEPYSFYSISTYGSYELVFNKNRYYSNVDPSIGYNGKYPITINYLLSINGAVKVGYIPVYKVEDKTTKYFNEGLVFTTSSSVPMTANSYAQYYYQNKAQMKNQYAVADVQAFSGFASIGVSSYGNIMGGVLSKAGEMVNPVSGGVNPAGIADVAAGMFGGLAKAGGNMGAHLVNSIANRVEVGMNIKAKLADMGAKPDPIKQAGSDFVYDMKSKELGVYLNHYTIDSLSYNTNARAFEKIGYYVNLYDTIHAVDRVGWNYVQLSLFDWNPSVNIMDSQENTIRRIFAQGVMLLHDKTYLTSGHNFETILE